MAGDGWHHLLLWWLAHWIWLFRITVLFAAMRQAARWFRTSAATSRSLRGSPDEILLAMLPFAS